jgi:hypothetical protein
MEPEMNSGSLDGCLRDKFFWNLFSGLDARETNWLLSDEPRNSVFVYNHSDKSVTRAGFEIPWPVLFLLGFRHRKHRYIGARLPDVCGIVDAVGQAIDKLKWRAFFANTSDKPFVRAMQYRRRISHFSGISSPEVSGLCFQLRSAIYEATSTALSKARSMRSSAWSNVLPIEKAARDWLAISDWCAVPTDKDGGFCLVALRDLISVQSALLSGPWYRPVEVDSLEQTWRWIVPAYRRLAKKIAGIDDRVSSNLLCASLDSGSRRFASSLTHTCKTHKDDGDVAFRPLHASSSHSFVGIMSWVAMILHESLSKYSHLAKSSKDVVQRMSALHLAENDVFLHMDLKDFFMTGSPSWLVRHCSLIIPMKFREVFREALQLILDNQFITAHFFPMKLWKVIVGSGMGLRCSSDVADAAFLHAVELCGLALLSGATRERFGIISYTRFRDNLLFVCKPDFQKIRSLKLHIEGSILPYIGTLEEASHIGISFLDVTFVKDDNWRMSGVISFNPCLKSTSLLQVLSLRSSHHPTTHCAWMKAYMLRLRRNSSCLTWYRTIKWQCLYRLRKAGIDQALVSEVERASRFTFPVPTLSSRHRIQRCHSSVDEQNCSFWVKLPFHPVWASCVNSSLARLSKIPGIIEILQQIDPHYSGFRAAWSLVAPCLSAIVRKY